MADPREPYGRTFHEQGRLTVNAEREKPFGVEPDFNKRTDEQREIDMRGASAVAAQAVHDAGLENERMKAQLFAFGAHLPAIRRALTIAVADSQYEAEAKPYRAAIQALGIQDRSDEKGAGS